MEKVATPIDILAEYCAINLTIVFIVPLVSFQNVLLRLYINPFFIDIRESMISPNSLREPFYTPSQRFKEILSVLRVLTELPQIGMNQTFDTFDPGRKSATNSFILVQNPFSKNEENSCFF